MLDGLARGATVVDVGAGTGTLAIALVDAWPDVHAIGGFAGAKLYYLAEVAGGDLTPHDFGGSGFTWYGGLIGGALAVLVVARRQRLALGEIAAMTAIPLAVAYGIGRLGCLLASDGTYGAPTDLPWAMRFPEGPVPTDLVHLAPLYEALASFAIAAALWWLRDRVRACRAVRRLGHAHA